MADERPEQDAEQAPKPPPAKGGGKKMLFIIIGVVVVLLGAGGFVGYKMLSAKKTDAEHGEKKEEAKSVLVAMDPFVVNLSEHGRYLKLTIQLELTAPTVEELVKVKTPNIRDVIITLLSSKSTDSVSSPEGKILLKDEILLRANQAVGKEVFKNLYYTEFVMQ